MTNSANNKALFNSQQESALAALGLPIWRQRESVASIEPSSASFCYRLNDWLLVLSQQLPVQRPQWLLDLARTLDVAASELAELALRDRDTWPQAQQLRIEVCANFELTHHVKRQLWAKLSSTSSLRFESQ